jgi:hypothetical protein
MDGSRVWFLHNANRISKRPAPELRKVCIRRLASFAPGVANVVGGLERVVGGRAFRDVGGESFRSIRLPLHEVPEGDEAACLRDEFRRLGSVERRQKN